MVEEFFKNQYSMDQRFAVLNAIALGARELASLPVPPSKVPLARVSFPSKRLPSALDRKYITATDHLNAPVQHLLEDISRQAATSVHGPPDDQAPQLARERHLRLRQPPKVIDVTSSVPPSLNSLIRTAPVHKMPTTFTTVAAEYFIHPLLSRFWLFLRDEQAREDRSAHLPSAHRYRGAGTGLILSPPVLSHLLATLAVLMHAGRNAPAWPAVLAPDALELALVLGSRPVSLLDAEEEHSGANADAPSNTAGMGARDTHASVLGAALELALAILAGAADTDGGRTLALEHTPLLLGVGEWAGKVLGMLERGERAKGGGGAREARLGAASAGVLLKVEEIAGRWRRSMSQIT
jgi:telomere length regulation protein